MGLIIVSLQINAQILWYTHFEKGLAAGAANGKLIVLDFWASWCSPCVTMDRQLWSVEEMNGLADRFVAVRIDVDVDKKTAFHYNTKAIPKVVITTAQGDVLWEKTGFSTAEEYLRIFRSFPGDVSNLYTLLDNSKNLASDFRAQIDVAVEFQRLAELISSASLRNALLNQSVSYFRKASKLSNTDGNKEEVELHLVLNDLYRGNAQKALKNYEKNHPAAVSGENSELARFVLASCYKGMNDEARYHELKVGITDEKFLERLNR